MKKDITFIVSMAVFGALVGLMVCAILMAIAIPSFSNYILTLSEKADFEKLETSAFLFSPAKFKIFKFVFLAIIVIVGGWFFYFLNSNLFKAFKSRTGVLKFIITVVICIVWFTALVLLSSRITGAGMVTPSGDNITSFLFVVLSTMTLWFVAGETGWAGDYSSWKMGSQDKKAEPIKTLIMGAVVGAVFYCLLLLNNALFTKYFALVSDALDESGETSYKGFVLLTYSLVVLGSFTMGVLGWLTAGLSPTFRDTRSRVKILASLAIFLSVTLAVAIPYFINVGKKYDMDKKGIAAAVGIPAVSSVEKSLLMFGENKKGKTVSLKKYPMEVKGFCFSGGDSSIAVSPENLSKVDEYIQTHKNQSVYYYAAQETLYKGYFLLGDIGNAMKAMMRASEDILIARMVLIRKLQQGVVDQNNLSYLKMFEDTSKWHIGGGSMLRLARAYAYQGAQKDADRWVKKATEAKVDMKDFKMPATPVLTKGTITGAIKFATGKQAGLKAVLLRGETTSLDDYSLAGSLLDTTDIGNTGLFTFKNLGAGSYQIAIIADKAVMSYDIPTDKLKTQNAPGIIKLDAKKPTAYLGTITIGW